MVQVISMILALFLTACHSGSNSPKAPSAPTPPSEQVPVNPTVDVEPVDPLTDFKSRLDGTWGASLFERKCHLFYTFSGLQDSQEQPAGDGRFMTRLICRGLAEGEAVMQISEGRIEIRSSTEDQFNITLNREAGSCGNHIFGESLALTSLEGEDLIIGEHRFSKLTNEDFADRLAKIKLVSGCFKFGSINRFKPEETSHVE